MKKLVVVGLLALTGVALIAVTWHFGRSDDPGVNTEPIGRRDLKAIVSASGTIQPKLSVDMSASMMGRVTRLVVEEGDRVKAGQFLLQIDPENLQAAVNRGEAVLKASESNRQQAQVAVETARVNLDLARENLERQQELWSLRLIAREVYDQAVAEVAVRETELKTREVEVGTASQRIQQERATLDSARYDLTQVTITSPINGIVTRRNIEEGETVVVGTMNNPGTVLLTVADFSILEAELEVDETDIPSVQFNQYTEITIDALPDDSYIGVVTEIGNSPIQDTTQSSTGQLATNFKVVVTLDGEVPGVRPGFTCTADITTATRKNALAVPIQATTVREVELSASGKIVRPAINPNPNIAATPESVVSPADTTTTEQEGVFIVRDGLAMFVPVITGIAGERYFEALSGLAEGDQVITGPFNVVRNLADGDPVTVTDESNDQDQNQDSPSSGGFRFGLGR